MAKAHDDWKVHAHRPLEKLAANLWRVEGDLPAGNGTRVMTIAKRSDGKLVIHNSIALEEDLMKEIEAFGDVGFIVVPNGYHRLDSKVFAKRYPKAKVIAPAGSRAKVEQVVKVDGTFGDSSLDDADVTFEHVAGTKDNEGVMTIKSSEGTTLVFTDAINNLAKLGGLFGFILAPTGQPSVPRIARWMMIKDKSAFRGHIERLADDAKLHRVIVSHGAMMTDAPAKGLRTALTCLD